MTPGQIAESILLLGPGFLFWKTLYLSGAQHRRPEWEWVVWSVLASLAIAALTQGLRAVLGPYVTFGEPLATYVEGGSRFLIAVVLGAGAGYVWRTIKASPHPRADRIERYIRDSAWDLVMDEASSLDAAGNWRFGVQVTIDIAGQTESYYGYLSAFGYEAADVERWIYLTNVHAWDPVVKGYRRKPNTRGMLFHADRVLRIRLIDSPTATEQAGTPPAPAPVAA